MSKMRDNVYNKNYMLRKKMNQVFGMCDLSQFLNLKMKFTLRKEHFPPLDLISS